MTFQYLTPYQYVLVDIANHWGLDKLTWDERIAWTQENDHQLESLVDQAETPPMFYAAVQALRDVQQGKPTGHGISLDATASGAQLLAVLSGCESSAKLCNIIDAGHRSDLYSAIYQAMLEETGGDAKITRADCKAAILTALYGSKAQPIRVFGTGPMLQLFYATMEKHAGGIWTLNEELLNMWQEDALNHSWTLSDGFEVEIPVIDTEARHIHFMDVPVQVDIKVNKGTKKGLSLAANITHSLDGMVLREVHRRCSYDPDTIQRVLELLLSHSKQVIQIPNKSKMFIKLWDLYKESGFLSARILDYIDGETINFLSVKDQIVIQDLIKSLPNKPFEIMSVHDCFRVKPLYGNDLRIQYNQVMSNLAKSDMLQFLASQIMKTTVKVERTTDLYDQVLQANYSLS